MKKLLLCFLNRFLYTSDINKLAKIKLGKVFLGAFPADFKPMDYSRVKQHRPCCWIWNTDESDKEGQHWVAVWLTSKKMFFFDSFALTPAAYNRSNWYEYCKELNVQFIPVMKKPYQSKLTGTCGNWSLLYLFNKAKGMSMPFNYKSKITNDIKLKQHMNVNFGKSRLDKIYSLKCKKHIKKNEQKACCFNKIRIST